jgi:hypothetical protein
MEMHSGTILIKAASGHLNIEASGFVSIQCGNSSVLRAHNGYVECGYGWVSANVGGCFIKAGNGHVNVHCGNGHVDVQCGEGSIMAPKCEVDVQCGQITIMSPQCGSGHISAPICGGGHIGSPTCGSGHVNAA